MHRVLFSIIAATVMTGCGPVNRYFGLKDDNVFEEAIEEAIEERTGVDIDLTPEFNPFSRLLLTGRNPLVQDLE